MSLVQRLLGGGASSLRKRFRLILVAQSLSVANFLSIATGVDMMSPGVTDTAFSSLQEALLRYGRINSSQ